MKCAKTAAVRLLVVLFVPVLGEIDEKFMKNTEVILSESGYPAEAHRITTEDGYILSLVRIPPAKPSDKKPIPILCVHGLLGSSADWVITGPHISLSYLLADNNYDVWLLNCRGTRPSTNHTTLNTNSAKFWDFSWHEVGIYDTRSSIDYILEQTGSEQVVHIGHSQGCTSFYVLMAEMPEYNAKVRAHIGYAPAAYLCNLSNIFLRLGSMLESIGLLNRTRKILGDFNVGARIPILEDIGVRLCASPLSGLCPILIQIVAAVSRDQFNNSLVPLLLGHYPNGGSTKQVVHYAQSIQSCQFKRYQNNPRQKTKAYNVKNINVPIYGFYGGRDTIQNPKDTLNFRNDLPNGFAGTYKITNFDHSDFVLARDARTKVYTKTLAILEQL